MRARAISTRLVATGLVLGGIGYTMQMVTPVRDLETGRAWSTALGIVANSSAKARILLDGGIDSARSSYERRPAIALALTALLALPCLVVAGGVLHWRRRRALHAKADRIVVADSATELLGRSLSVRNQAQIEIMPAPGGQSSVRRLDLGRDMVRIGREEDNDVLVPDDAVERYHAIIERASPREFVLHDVSGPGGPGVILNGIRVAFARLEHGDVIEVGSTKVRFEAHAA